MTVTITKWDAAEHLDIDEAIAAYLADVMESGDRNHIVHALNTIARARGMTQGALADKAGVHISHIQRIEANNSQPTVDVLKRLAEALELSLDLLVFERASEVATRQMVDRELVEQFAAVESFADGDKQAVKTILSAMILKQRIASAVADHAPTRPVAPAEAAA